MMTRGLWTILAVSCGVLFGGQCATAADKPTITSAKGVKQQNGNYNFTAEGTFPKQPNGTRVTKCQVEVRWVDSIGRVQYTELTAGQGNATNGDPTGSFAGTKEQVTPRNWKPQMRAIIRGVPPGGTMEGNLTDWSDWTDAQYP